MVRSTSQNNDDGEEEQAQDGNDFDGSKDKFRLSVNANGENIQSKDQNDDDGDPHGGLLERIRCVSLVRGEHGVQSYRYVSRSRPVVDDN